jgi:hypothetical protein
MGGFLSGAGRAADAITALDESSSAPGMPETAPLIADVGMRRALACADDGRGASAVTEAAAAVTACQALAAQVPAGQRTSLHPVLRGLARVYTVGATILARFGDPDAAAGSADRGIRIYMSDPTGTGAFAVAPEDMGNLVSGTSVAATIHALHGRIDISLFAAQVGAKFSGLPEWKEAMRSVAEQVQRMSAEQQAEFGRRRRGRAARTSDRAGGPARPRLHRAPRRDDERHRRPPGSQCRPGHAPPARPPAGLGCCEAFSRSPG